MFAPRIKLAIYDKDLKARSYGKFPVSQDGTKIRVKRGGTENFNPEFDNETYIELPNPAWMLWKPKWERLYIVPNGSPKCVNFKTQTVLEPDPEKVMKAAENKILENIGREKIEVPLVMYLMFAALILIAMKVFGVM